jgi:hypothetical protein
MSAAQPTDAEIVHAVEDMTGRHVAAWNLVTERGYTAARRLLVTFTDEGRAFVKAAVDERTTRKLRAEMLVYSQLQAAYLPHVIAWREGELPILVLEDPTDASWPPPSTPTAIGAVCSAIEEINATPPPRGLPRLESQRDEFCGGWARVAVDPTPLLSVGLCSATWLTHALPTLMAAAEAAILDGEALLHLDVRSDNLCLREGRAVIFDWDFASIGNPAADLACWLPSLHMEGGPAPETLLADGGPLAASVSGYFAHRVGRPASSPREARHQELTLLQLEGALSWAGRALGLPPLDLSPRVL